MKFHPPTPINHSTDDMSSDVKLKMYQVMPFIIPCLVEIHFAVNIYLSQAHATQFVTAQRT